MYSLHIFFARNNYEMNYDNCLTCIKFARESIRIEEIDRFAKNRFRSLKFKGNFRCDIFKREWIMAARSPNKSEQTCNIRLLR